MAVSTISKVSLVLNYGKGLGQCSFSNIKKTATDQQIHDTATAICRLLRIAVTGIEKVKEEVITEN